MNNLSTNYLQVLGQINLDKTHVIQAFDYYQERYLTSAVVQAFVKHSFILPKKLRDSEFIGFCDRTMGVNIPKRRSFEGGAIRGSLQRNGLIRASGHELFRGCIVFPRFNKSKQIVGAVGYRIAKRIRGWQPQEIHWKKPKPDAFKQSAIIVAKEILHEKAHH